MNTISKKNFLKLFVCSFGIAMLLTSPYALERVTIKPYYVFGIFHSFVIPHLLSLLALGAVLFVAFLNYKDFNKLHRFVRLACIAILILYMVRGIVLTAGYSVQRLAVDVAELFNYFGNEWVTHVVVKRLGVFVLFVVGVVVGAIILKNPAPFLRGAVALGWTLGLLLVTRVAPVASDDYYFEKIHKKLLISNTEPQNAKRRVVWIIFDELDYARLNEKRNPNLHLPNIDKLIAQSVSSENAVSPAWATAISLPALVTGSYLSDTKPNGSSKLTLTFASGEKSELQETNNIFSKLDKEKLKSSIIGYYHPYCSFFPFVSSCVSYSVFSYPTWWWGIWQAFRGIPGGDLFFRNFSFKNEDFFSTSVKQLEALNRELDNSQSSLLFAHLNIPHLPGHNDGGFPSIGSEKLLNGYDHNLVTVDKTVAIILSKLQSRPLSENNLLIITSDHWLRVNTHKENMTASQFFLEIGEGSTEVQKVPFIVKLFNDSLPIAIKDPISTIHTSNFIENYLSGELNNHRDIAAWWINTAYVSPRLANSKVGE